MAQDRIALVVAVGNYDKLRKLDNPVIDGKAIAELLRRSGFIVVTAIDTPFAELNDALVRFGGLAKRAKEAVVYLAGHGFERGAANIFAAKDADIDCASEDMTRSMNLRDFYARMSGVPKLVMVLDACRDNPFPFCQRKTRSSSSRSAAGFGDLQGDAQSVGSRDQEILVANSTARGELAEDGEPGKHSPYAKALLRYLSANPNLTFRAAHSAAAKDVQRETSLRQRPSYTVVGDEPEICLAGKNCVAFSQPTETEAERMKREVAESGAIEARARNEAETLRIAALAKQEAARAEARALAEAKARDDAAAKARAEAEVRVAAGRAQMEKEAAARAEVADAAASAAARARNEAARAQAEAKAREDAEKAQAAKAATDLLVLTRDIQKELQRVGCSPGNPDGTWGTNSRRAAAKFVESANVTLLTDTPSVELLNFLIKMPDASCIMPKGETTATTRTGVPAERPPAAAAKPTPTSPSASSGGNSGGSQPSSRGGDCNRSMFSGQTCTDSRGRTCIQTGAQRNCQ